MNQNQEEMDDFFAVFNCHDCDRRKARNLFYGKFGRDKYMKAIYPYIRKGIMSIFNNPPGRYEKYFVEKLADIVRARIKKRDAPLTPVISDR